MFEEYRGESGSGLGSAGQQGRFALGAPAGHKVLRLFLQEVVGAMPSARPAIHWPL